MIVVVFFAEKENEFCAPTSKIFQGENVLEIRLKLALIDLSSSSIYEGTSTFFFHIMVPSS